MFISIPNAEQTNRLFPADIVGTSASVDDSDVFAFVMRVAETKSRDPRFSDKVQGAVCQGPVEMLMSTNRATRPSASQHPTSNAEQLREGYLRAPR